MQKTLDRLLAQQRKWESLLPGAAGMKWPTDHGPPPSRLQETRNFASNPGDLRMFSYLPPHASAGCALVVVLHGCAQNAASYDRGAGWSTLADRFGFALLLPEQQRSNNPSGCFNWFQTGDTERGQGEALSIRQMVEKMVDEHGLDRARVFVTGLSAGGAMTSVMLATYPDVFAGGAIIAGLPYGAASNVQQAFENMFQCPPRSARAWGDLVRGASSHRGPWPRISVWHGGADATVVPSNATEIVKQWTDVHGLAITRSVQAMVDGHPRQAWLNEAGDELIESYNIAHMAHGTPLATGEADDECGAAGPFLLEVGISSSYHIARFFGLTAGARGRVSPAKSRAVISVPARPRIDRPAAAVAQPQRVKAERRDKKSAMTLPIDIGAVIAGALKAAGLTKGR